MKDKRYFKRKVKYPRYKFTQSQMNTLLKYMNNMPAMSSTIDAGYTYFGQFIAHEIVQSTNLDKSYKTTPYMSLDSLYGIKTDLSLFDCVGKFIINEDKNGYVDFMRNSKGTYLLLEKRNDENILISQFHCLWLKLHNKLLEYCLEIKEIQTSDSKIDKVERVRNLLVYIFQQIVINDYLSTLIDGPILKHLRSCGSVMYPNNSFNKIPLEFSHAAFRFGHSMIKNSYTFSIDSITNNHVGHKLVNLFLKDKRKSIDIDQVVDWKLFFGDSNEKNVANKIDLNIDVSMNNLDKNVSKKLCPLQNIVEINLTAGESSNIHSGYEIHELLIKLDVNGVLKASDLLIDLEDDVFDNEIFKDLTNKNLPLWLYILHEYEMIKSFDSNVPGPGSKLGKCGSFIVAEVILNSIKLATDTAYKRKNEEIVNAYFKIESSEYLRINNVI